MEDNAVDAVFVGRDTNVHDSTKHKRYLYTVSPKNFTLVNDYRNSIVAAVIKEMKYVNMLCRARMATRRRSSISRIFQR